MNWEKFKSSPYFIVSSIVVTTIAVVISILTTVNSSVIRALEEQIKNKEDKIFVLTIEKNDLQKKLSLCEKVNSNANLTENTEVSDLIQKIAELKTENKNIKRDLNLYMPGKFRIMKINESINPFNSSSLFELKEVNDHNGSRAKIFFQTDTERNEYYLRKFERIEFSYRGRKYAFIVSDIHLNKNEIEYILREL